MPPKIQKDKTSRAFDDALIKRLLIYFLPYRFLVGFALTILIIAKAIEAWIPLQIGYLAQFILTKFFLDIQATDAFQLLWRLGSGILAWIFVVYLLDNGHILIKNWVGQKALYRLRVDVFERIQKLPMSFYDRDSIGKLMTRTIHDVDQINQLFMESVVPLIGSFFLFLGIFTGFFFLNWQACLLVFCLLPFMWKLADRFRRTQRKSYSNIRSVVSHMNTFVQEHLMGISIIRGLNLHSTEKQKFDEMNESHFKANKETVKRFAFFFTAIEFFQTLSLILIFAVLSYSMKDQRFPAGTYFTLSLYIVMIFRPLADLSERYNILQAALAAAERIFEILDMPIESETFPLSIPLAEIDTIEFQNVWFAYEKENWILKDLSFLISKDESIALVGATGSGKTSVMNLILRFYDFQKGEILINGRSIRLYHRAVLRRCFSVILQDPVIFSGTLEENVRLYDKNLSESQIKKSLEDVQLTLLIEKFPHKFKGLLKERGLDLSVGEMQLISLARVFAHPRSFIIFDEATSHIDMQTETLIQNALKKILAQKTSLLIAHRLSTIRDADRIFVLNGGRLVETGSHEELIKENGLYEKLYRLQFSV